MRAVNNDATTYQSKSPEKFLETADKAKKKKYPDVCLKQHQQFAPFIVSVEVLFKDETEETLKRIAIRLATK